jgi:low affinity Fe/Cu permease
MMNMSGMMERCVDAMGFMMGGMMGSGTMLVVLMVLLLVWLIGLSERSDILASMQKSAW